MFRTLRLQLRFLLPLALALIATAYLALPLLDRVTLRWFARDLNSRGALVATALSDSVVAALHAGRPLELESLFAHTTQDERLYGIGLCSPDDRMLVHTAAFPADLSCLQALEISARPYPRLELAGGPVHVAVHDVLDQLRTIGAANPASVVGAAASDGQQGTVAGMEASAAASGATSTGAAKAAASVAGKHHATERKGRRSKEEARALAKAAAASAAAASAAAASAAEVELAASAAATLAIEAGLDAPIVRSWSRTSCTATCTGPPASSSRG